MISIEPDHLYLVDHIDIKTEVQPLRGWKGACILSLWVGTHSDKSMTPSGSDIHTTYRPQRGQTSYPRASPEGRGQKKPGPLRGPTKKY